MDRHMLGEDKMHLWPLRMWLLGIKRSLLLAVKTFTIGTEHEERGSRPVQDGRRRTGWL